MLCFFFVCFKWKKKAKDEFAVLNSSNKFSINRTNCEDRPSGHSNMAATGLKF